MSMPLIGITTYQFTNRHGYDQCAVSQAYSGAVASTGGCPVLIPLNQSPQALETLIGRLDGVLFSGGGDIDPRYYNSQPTSLVTEIDLTRDEFEIRLLQLIAQDGRPFLGICRGLQLINVALGGSLYEDILEQHPGAQRHQFFPEKPRHYLAHTAAIDGNSRLERILGKGTLQVNSLHHQGIRRLAPGLRASAFAPDGIVEAVELSGHPYGIGVQWHPENLQTYPEMQALFRSFVEACGG